MSRQRHLSRITQGERYPCLTRERMVIHLPKPGEASLHLSSLPQQAVVDSTSSLSKSLRLVWSRLRCAMFGHDIQSGNPGTTPEVRQRCRCGAGILAEDNRESRVGHILSCFFFGHDYLRISDRHGHIEFICKDCGHPLMFDRASSAYGSSLAFHKTVSFVCILRGHQVHPIAKRNGLTEYACHCGHSFLLDAQGLSTYRHPVACAFRGHYISFVERRGEWSEFRCRVCGHPFCFHSET